MRRNSLLFLFIICIYTVSIAKVIPGIIFYTDSGKYVEKFSTKYSDKNLKRAKLRNIESVVLTNQTKQIYSPWNYKTNFKKEFWLRFYINIKDWKFKTKPLNEKTEKLALFRIQFTEV